MGKKIELQINLWRCFHVLKRSLAIILILTVIAFLASVIVTRGTNSDIYQSSSTVYSTAGGGYDLTQAMQTTSMMRLYAEVVSSMKVLDSAAQIIGNPAITGQTLAGMVSVNTETSSSVLRISVNSPSPELAVTAANAIATAFVSEITSITSQSNIYVLDTASSYILLQDGQRQTWIFCLVVAALVFIVLCAFVILKDILSSKIHSMEGTSLYGELEVVGLIPNFSVNRPGEK